MNRLVTLIALTACVQAELPPSDFEALALTDELPATSPPPPLPPTTAAWSWFDLGDDIGANGMAVTNWGGASYLATTTNINRSWSLFKGSVGGDPTHIFAAEVSSGGWGGATVDGLVVADVTGDGRDEVIELRAGVVSSFDLLTQSVVSTFTAPAGAATLAAADLDGDGVAEIAIGGTNLTVHMSSGATLATIPGISGPLAIGQADADPGLEIASTDGFVVDTATASIQWDFGGAFGSDIELTDSDGDGMDELLVYNSNWVHAYDVDTRLPAWSISTGWADVIATGDLDGDGVDELLVGDNQWGDVTAYDVTTRLEIGHIPNPEHGVSAIAVGDLNGDAVAEVFFSCGHSSSGADLLIQADWRTGNELWDSVDLDGPFYGPLRGDVDGDGIQEIVIASHESDSGYGSSRILVFDPNTRSLESMSPEIISGSAWEGLGDIALADMDGDGTQEILVAADEVRDGAWDVWSVDALHNYTLMGSYAAPFGVSQENFTAIAGTDLTGDGILEVVVGSDDFLYAFNLAGVQVWQSPMFLGRVEHLELADTDMDGTDELVARVRGGDLWIFDGSTGALEAQITGSFDHLSLEAGTPPILVTESGAGLLDAWRWNGATYTRLGGGSFPNGSVDGFTPLRLTPLLSSFVFYGDSGQLAVMNVTGFTELWRSGTYGTALGIDSVIQIADRELWTTGTYGVVVFER